MPHTTQSSSSTTTPSSKPKSKRPRHSFILVPISPTSDNDDTPSPLPSDNLSLGRGKRRRRTTAAFDLSDEALGLVEPLQEPASATAKGKEEGRDRQETAGTGEEGAKRGRKRGKLVAGGEEKGFKPARMIDWDELPSAASRPKRRGRRSSPSPLSSPPPKSSTVPDDPKALGPSGVLPQHLFPSSSSLDNDCITSSNDAPRTRRSATLVASSAFNPDSDMPPSARRITTRRQSSLQSHLLISELHHQSSPASDTSSPLSSAPSTARSTPRVSSIPTTDSPASSLTPPPLLPLSASSDQHRRSTRSRIQPQTLPAFQPPTFTPRSLYDSEMEVDEILCVSPAVFARSKRKIPSSQVQDEPPCLGSLSIDEPTPPPTPASARKRGRPRKSLLPVPSKLDQVSLIPTRVPVRATRSTPMVPPPSHTDSPRPAARRTSARRSSLLSSSIPTLASSSFNSDPFPSDPSSVNNPSSRKKPRVKPSFHYEPHFSSSSSSSSEDEVNKNSFQSTRSLRSRQQPSQATQPPSSRSTVPPSQTSTRSTRQSTSKADTPEKKPSQQTGRKTKPKPKAAGTGRGKQKKKRIIVVPEPEEGEEPIKVPVACGLQMEPIAELEEEEEEDDRMHVDGVPEEEEELDWREAWWQGLIRRRRQLFQWTMVI